MAMIKLVVLTDTHANLPALQAALASIDREGYDLLIHTGDAIGIGPYPAETLDRLLNTPRSHYIMGNHDMWFAHGLPQSQPDSMTDGEVEHHRWTHAQLDPRLRAVVTQWPMLIQDTFEGVPTALLHYALLPSGDDFRPIIRQPSPTDLDSLFAPLAATLVCYGHHHPFSDMQGQARYINPGALGCFSQPLARYAVATFQNGGYRIDHRAVPYTDVDLYHTFEARRVPERELIYRYFFGGRFGS